VEASGNNYVRVAFFGHVFTTPIHLLFCGFGFLNGSKNFSIKALSVVYVGTLV